MQGNWPSTSENMGKSIRTPDAWAFRFRASGDSHGFCARRMPFPPRPPGARHAAQAPALRAGRATDGSAADDPAHSTRVAAGSGGK